MSHLAEGRVCRRSTGSRIRRTRSISTTPTTRTRSSDSAIETWFACGRMKTSRRFSTQVYSNQLRETINGTGGSGFARSLERSARAKGVEILPQHKLTAILRETPSSGRVLGITATVDNRKVNIRARKGIIIATGGHTSNVEFRRIFDPRLTEEYQVAGEPYSRQNADGEILAMGIGASLWATANQNTGEGTPFTTTRNIGS